MNNNKKKRKCIFEICSFDVREAKIGIENINNLAPERTVFEYRNKDTETEKKSQPAQST